MRCVINLDAARLDSLVRVLNYYAQFFAKDVGRRQHNLKVFLRR